MVLAGVLAGVLGAITLAGVALVGEAFLGSSGLESESTLSLAGDFDLDFSVEALLSFCSYSAFLRAAFSSLLLSGAG